MKNILIACATLAFASASTFAATVSYSSTFPSTQTDFSSPLAIQQFDPTLGSLTSLSITLAGSATGTGTLKNNNTTTKSYTVNLANDLTLTDPLSNTLAEILPLFSASISVAGNGGTGTASGTGTATVTNAYSDVPTLLEFTGVGSLSANIAGSGASGFSGASNTNFSATTASGGTVSITYNYTPTVVTGTPEPATMGLLGSALLGLGFLKFRKKA